MRSTTGRKRSRCGSKRNPSPATRSVSKSSRPRQAELPPLSSRAKSRGSDSVDDWGGPSTTRLRRYARDDNGGDARDDNGGDARDDNGGDARDDNGGDGVAADSAG